MYIRMSYVDIHDIFWGHTSNNIFFLMFKNNMLEIINDS